MLAEKLECVKSEAKSNQPEEMSEDDSDDKAAKLAQVKSEEENLVTKMERVGEHDSDEGESDDFSVAERSKKMDPRKMTFDFYKSKSPFFYYL